MRGRDHVLELLAGEDVGGGEVSLGVPVFAGLGGGHVHHLQPPSTTKSTTKNASKHEQARKQLGIRK